MENCLFCKIIKGDIPCQKVFENELLIAFKDIYPKAKTHLLIVPKKHIDTIADLKKEEGDQDIVGAMVMAAKEIGDQMKLSGYTLQFNVGKSGGQEIFHIHLHLKSNEG